MQRRNENDTELKHKTDEILKGRIYLPSLQDGIEVEEYLFR